MKYVPSVGLAPCVVLDANTRVRHGLLRRGLNQEEQFLIVGMRLVSGLPILLLQMINVEIALLLVYPCSRWTSG